MDCHVLFLSSYDVKWVLLKIVIFSGPPRFEGDRPRFGDRDGYRGGPRGPPGEFGEKGGAPADYQPSFRVSYHLRSGIQLYVLYV